MWQDRSYASPPLGWYVSRARATWWLVGITVAAHVAHVLFRSHSDSVGGWIMEWLPATSEGWRSFVRPIDWPSWTSIQFWRPITYLFVHAGTGHILGNMLFLGIAGSLLEPQIGSRAFLKIYFASGIVGSLSTLLHGNHTIGASGAINGVLVALAVLLPDVVILFMFIIPMKIKWVVAIFLGIDVLNVLSSESPGNDSICHLLGAATGFGIAFVGPRYIAPWRERRRSERVREEQRVRQVEAIDEEQELDRLLEKISREGMPNLTEAERRFLKKVSGKYQNSRRD